LVPAIADVANSNSIAAMTFLMAGYSSGSVVNSSG
jgi:hypothetical protein